MRDYNEEWNELMSELKTIERKFDAIIADGSKPSWKVYIDSKPPVDNRFNAMAQAA